MSRLESAWNRLLPRTADARLRARAGLVVGTCLSVVLACVGLLLTWIISGDLQWETAVAAAALALVLGGNAALARSGRASLATWLLVALLFALISVNVWIYGASSATTAAYAIPIVLAACNQGLWAGLAVAGGGSALIWLQAAAETAAWYVPDIPSDVSHLTFDAPAYTVVFLIVALIVGAWGRQLLRTTP